MSLGIWLFSCFTYVYVFVCGILSFFIVQWIVLSSVFVVFPSDSSSTTRRRFWLYFTWSGILY